MQIIHAGTRQSLLKFSIPIQIAGIALTGFGLLAFPSLVASIVNDVPALADPVTDWVLVIFGAVVVICNGLCLANRARKHRSQGVDFPVAHSESNSLLQSSDESIPSRSAILVPPKKNKIISAIFGCISALIFVGIGCAMLVSYFGGVDREIGALVFALIFVVVGLLFGLIARSWMSARIELDANGFISFQGVFVKRRYALSSIKSIKLNSNRGAHFVVIRTASSYFTVSDYSFSLAQLDLINKFCDPQGKLTSAGF